MYAVDGQLWVYQRKNENYFDYLYIVITYKIYLLCGQSIYHSLSYCGPVKLSIQRFSIFFRMKCPLYRIVFIRRNKNAPMCPSAFIFSVLTKRIPWHGREKDLIPALSTSLSIFWRTKTIIPQVAHTYIRYTRQTPHSSRWFYLTRAQCAGNGNSYPFFPFRALCVCLLVVPAISGGYSSERIWPGRVCRLPHF